MDQENLNQKSREQLEKDKLQAEIDILQARLKKEFPVSKPPGRMARLANFAKQWSAFVLGSVALFSAVFGVFVPLSKYLVEQRKALEYDLNGNMISFVNDLNADDPAVARRSIMMLSYYETNSVPILLYFLEDSENNQQEFRQKIIETVSRIYSENTAHKIVDMIIQRLEANFNRIQDERAKSIDTQRLRALYNIMDLVKGMELRSRDEERLKKVYQIMKISICENTNLRDDFDMIGLHSQICLYLDVEDKCD